MRKTILLLTGVLFCVTSFAQAPFTAGDGSAASPYQISTTAQLDAVRDHMTSHFILMNDLDLSADFPIWIPLGRTDGVTGFTAFSGFFDGQGHVISGVNITLEGEYAGLFAVTSGTIANLGVKGTVDIPFGGASALLTGYLGQKSAPGLLENCFAEGSVKTGTGTKVNQSVGLLMGSLTNASTVRGCYAKGSVIAENSEWVGGLVGRMMHATCFVFDSYSDVDVKGTMLVGGAMGRLYSPADRTSAGINFSSIYATGSVIGDDWVGGIAGDFYRSNATDVIAANSSVTATNGVNINRIAPIASGGGSSFTLDNMFGLATTEVLQGSTPVTIVSDIAGSDGLTKTLAELQDPIFYANWDMAAKWKMPETAGLPILKWQSEMGVYIEKVRNENTFFTFTQGKMLHIRNIAPQSQITVYNSSGQLIRQQTSTDTSDVVILPEKGIYIVKVQSGNNEYSDKVLCY